MYLTFFLVYFVPRRVFAITAFDRDKDSMKRFRFIQIKDERYSKGKYLDNVLDNFVWMILALTVAGRLTIWVRRVYRSITDR